MLVCSILLIVDIVANLVFITHFVLMNCYSLSIRDVNLSHYWINNDKKIQKNDVCKKKKSNFAQNSYWEGWIVSPFQFNSVYKNKLIK